MKMKNLLSALTIFGSSIAAFCQTNTNAQTADAEVWKLGWRMIESSWNDNFGTAELQFDSLLSLTGEIEKIFLITGLEIKSKLGKNDEIVKILHNQDEETLIEICTKLCISL